MAEIEIYSSFMCPYCYRAKKLLDSKGARYEEIDVFSAPKRRVEMTERASGKSSVPQIFIDGLHVGGCDELYALDAAGRLDPLLEGQAGE